MDRGTSFRKANYAEHLTRLGAACEWLAVDRGRAARYGDLVMEFFDKGARSREHVLAYSESCEIADLFDLWERHIADFPGLEGKIRSVFSKGPLLREDENPAASSNRARNDAFGYLVAGRLLAAGVPVVAVEGSIARGATCESEADITFQWGGFIDIECKRPQTDGALVERAKEACEQIARPSRSGRHGIIALDCSVLVRPAGALLESDSVEAAERLVSGVLERTVSPKVVPCLTNSVLGFLLFARVPAMTRIRRLAIVTALGKPFREFRPDSISSLLVVSNSEYSGPDVLRYVAERMVGATHEPVDGVAWAGERLPGRQT